MLMRLRFLALHHLIELGDSMPQAIAVGEPLIADLERMLGPDHPDTLNARNSLAAAYQAAGRAADAIPLFEQHPGRPGAAAWPGPSRHPDLAEQPRGRLPGRGPGRRGDPAVRADPGRPGAAAGRRPSRHAELADQPGRRLPGRRAGPPRRSRWSSRPWPPGSSCWVPTIPTPWPRGTTSPAPTGRRAGPPRRSPCSSRTWPRASGCSVADHPRTVASRHHLDLARQEADQRRTRSDPRRTSGSGRWRFPG